MAKHGSSVPRLEATSPGAHSAVATGILAKAFELASLVLLVALVPRMLGPGDYGAFALGLSIVTIASAAISAGGSPTLARFVPAASAIERRAVARALGERVARRRALTVAAGLLVTAGCAAAFPATFPPITTGVLALAVVFDVAATLCFQLALGLGRYRVWSVRYPLQNLLLATAAILLGTLAGRIGALGAVAVASGGALLAGAVAGAAPLRGVRAAATLPADAGQFARYLGTSSLLLLVTHRSGIVIVSLLAGGRETGYAALAIGVALAAIYAAQQIFLLQLAALSLYADGDLPAAERQARRFAAQALAVLAVPALLGARALEPAISAIFGQDYGGAEAAFVPVLVLLPIVPLASLATQVASLRLRTKALAGASACGLAVFLLIAPAAVAAWGAPAATAALTASTLTYVAFLARALPGLAQPRLYLASALCAVGALLIVMLA